MENTNMVNKEDRISIFYLKEIWLHFHKMKTSPQMKEVVEWKYINGVFNALGIGIEPSIEYLMNSN